ncbi:Hypothetical protein PMT_2473 [Prochlorococcus marinus str. MIT 9313]|uniref:Uncharacterized protein n=1 Tax=Prochlorococcus marinus (strain MIT 9313) TaxID=74547 RepID=B9ERW6_PROMM|nr:Hypothetical protein PMT_2473 [Prochlorococcus marinus str. MIT 9313]
MVLENSDKESKRPLAAYGQVLSLTSLLSLSFYSGEDFASHLNQVKQELLSIERRVVNQSCV